MRLESSRIYRLDILAPLREHHNNSYSRARFVNIGLDQIPQLKQRRYIKMQFGKLLIAVSLARAVAAQACVNITINDLPSCSVCSHAN
jgi:hypothetical protein